MSLFLGLKFYDRPGKLLTQLNILIFYLILISYIKNIFQISTFFIAAREQLTNSKISSTIKNAPLLQTHEASPLIRKDSERSATAKHKFAVAVFGTITRRPQLRWAAKPTRPSRTGEQFWLIRGRITARLRRNGTGTGTPLSAIRPACPSMCVEQIFTVGRKAKLGAGKVRRVWSGCDRRFRICRVWSLEIYDRPDSGGVVEVGHRSGLLSFDGRN